MPNICPFCDRPTSGRNRICDSPICRQELRKSWNESTISVPEGYVEANVFAKIKNITRQAVTQNCRKGKYPGAFQDQQSGRWYIPRDNTVDIKHKVERRTKRPFKATEKEWNQIIEKAALTKYSVNEYILRKALDKKI